MGPFRCRAAPSQGGNSIRLWLPILLWLCTENSCLPCDASPGSKAAVCIVQWDSRLARPQRQRRLLWTHIDDKAWPAEEAALVAINQYAKLAHARSTASLVLALRLLCEADPRCAYLRVHSEDYWDIPAGWSKVKIVLDALELRDLAEPVASQVTGLTSDAPACENVLWMDSDAVLHVYHQSVSEFIRGLSNRTHGEDLIFSEDPYKSEDGVRHANAGVFLCKSTEEGHSVLREWLSHLDGVRQYWHPVDGNAGRSWECLLPRRGQGRVTKPFAQTQRCPWAGSSFEQGTSVGGRVVFPLRNAVGY
eukprot:scaffold1912_cov332-Prasinococcus_capsulatus_cf.AAC.2